jgi:hypothetical protein
MTWDAERKKLGRSPCTVVEIDLDFCSRTYGVAPCTATAADKCYNTFKTCRDKPNFGRTSKTYRFSDLVLDPYHEAFPSLNKVSSSPTRIDPAKGLGVRASVTIQITDHTHSDSGIDPYVTSRAYTPLKQGTFWGRLLARNRYYLGRPIRIKRGYLVDGEYIEANFQTSAFVVEKIDGPTSKGVVTITAKDPLKLADDDRTQVPAVTEGLLTSEILAGSTTFTVTTGKGAQYNSSGTVAIDDEFITYTRIGDTFTITGRASDGTTQDDHDTGSKVQDCRRYANVAAHQIIYNILVYDAGISASFIDWSAWNAEATTWMANALMTTVIEKPTGANSLVNQIAQQAGCYLWWDERAQKIQLRAIRPATWGEVHELNDFEHILENSTSVTEKPDERISQVWAYYGKTVPNLDDKPENYRVVFVKVDADAESEAEYNQSKVKVIYCPFIPATNPSQPIAIANQYLDKFKDNPRYLTLKVDAKDADVWTGSPVRVQTRLVQSPNGAVETLNMLVLEAKEVDAGTSFQLVLTESYFQGRYCYIMPNDAHIFTEASDIEKNTGGYICDTSTELMSDGSEGYKIV